MGICRCKVEVEVEVEVKAKFEENKSINHKGTQRIAQKFTKEEFELK
jgi:hypothetical protein